MRVGMIAPDGGVRRPVVRRCVVVLFAFIALFASVLTGVVTRSSGDAGAWNLVQWILCSWENPDEKIQGGEHDGESRWSYEPMPVHTLYQLATTDDLEWKLFSKTNVGADAQSPDSKMNLSNALSGKDYSAPKLDIVNTGNTTSKKYTPYDLIGFAPLNWTTYQGEWNYVQVYYCTDNDRGTGEDREPTDLMLNLYYTGRVRPTDTWDMIDSSQDPRVELKRDVVLAPMMKNFALNIANFLFNITKIIVAFSNALIQLSFTDIAAKFGIDKVAVSITKNLLNGLFVPLMSMMMAFTGVWMLWKGIMKYQTRNALGGLVRSLACMFAGMITLSMPNFVISLPNQLSLIVQYLVLNGINNSSTISGSDMCVTTSDSTSPGFKKKEIDFYSNGKIQTDAISDYIEDAGDGVARAVTCEYWRIFAFQPWVIGQYGTEYTNLWANGHAENGGKELGNNSKYPGSAALDLGNGKTIHNWALYQLSTQSMDHIPSSVMDADTGKITKPEEAFTDYEQYATKNVQTNGVNGDWYRVVDALSGWDADMYTSDGEPLTSDSANTDTSSGTDGGKIEKMVSWAEGIAKDDSHGYSQNNRAGNPDYDCSSLVYFALKNAGFGTDKIGTFAFATGIERDALMKAGFTKVDGANFKTGEGLKRGDVLWNSGHTGIYVGDGKVVHAYQDENGSIAGTKSGDQKAPDGNEEIGFMKIDVLSVPFTEAYRFEGAVTSTSGGSITNGSVPVSIQKENTEPTKYWNNWTGGNTGYRITVALFSILFAIIGLAAPLFLGITVVSLSIMMTVISMFAPVAFTFGMWQGHGTKVFKDWALLLWSTFLKRVIASVIYMVFLTLMLMIMKNLTSMTDYFKSSFLLLIVSYAFISQRDSIINKFSEVRGSQSSHIVNHIGDRTKGIAAGAAMMGVQAGTGAAIGIHEARKRGMTMKEARGNIARTAMRGATMPIRKAASRTKVGQQTERNKRASEARRNKAQAGAGNIPPTRSRSRTNYRCYVCQKELNPHEAFLSHMAVGRASCWRDLEENKRRAAAELHLDWDSGARI